MDAALSGGVVKAHLVRAAYQGEQAAAGGGAKAPKAEGKAEGKADAKVEGRATTPPPGKVTAGEFGEKAKKRAGSSGKAKGGEAAAGSIPAGVAASVGAIVGGGGASDDFLSKLEAAEGKGSKKKVSKKKKVGATKKETEKAVAAETAKRPLVKTGTSSAEMAAAAEAHWQQVWSHVQLSNLPTDVTFGVGELQDREPQLAATVGATLRPHFNALLDVYHKYSDVHLPGSAVPQPSFTPMPYRQADGSPPPADMPRELKSTDLHRLSENSWLQFCRDAKLIGDAPTQMLPTEACLIFTAVNTRRAARNLVLGADAEAGSIRGFTTSEFLEAIVQCACKVSAAAKEAKEGGGAEVLMTAEHVAASVAALVQDSILQKVAREDVRGFRQAMAASAPLVAALERAGPLIRAVHERYAKRGDDHTDFPSLDDQGGYGLSLRRFDELVWDAKLIGRELSRNAAKAAFVNALNAGDAFAGISEFGEIVVRLAHAITPLTREERVGAPPPPPKRSKSKDKWAGRGANEGLGATPTLPPPLLVPGGSGTIFEPSAELTLLGKLEAVCTKFVAIAGDAPEEVAHFRALYPLEKPRVRGQPLGQPVAFPTSVPTLPGPPPPPVTPPPDHPLPEGAEGAVATEHAEA